MTAPGEREEKIMITLKQLLLHRFENPIRVQASRDGAQEWVPDLETTAKLVVDDIIDGPFSVEAVNRMVRSGHFAGILPREEDRRKVFGDLWRIGCRGE
jgi:hypothetical protein